MLTVVSCLDRQFDEFIHPKTGRRSLAYQINYRSMDRSVTRLASLGGRTAVVHFSDTVLVVLMPRRNLKNSEINALHDEISRQTTEKFKVEIR